MDSWSVDAFFAFLVYDKLQLPLSWLRNISALSKETSPYCLRPLILERTYKVSLLVDEGVSEVIIRDLLKLWFHNFHGTVKNGTLQK